MLKNMASERNIHQKKDMARVIAYSQKFRYMMHRLITNTMDWLRAGWLAGLLVPEIGDNQSQVRADNGASRWLSWMQDRW